MRRRNQKLAGSGVPVPHHNGCGDPTTASGGVREHRAAGDVPVRRNPKVDVGSHRRRNFHHRGPILIRQRQLIVGRDLFCHFVTRLADPPTLHSWTRLTAEGVDGVPARQFHDILAHAQVGGIVFRVSRQRGYSIPAVLDDAAGLRLDQQISSFRQLPKFECCVSA